MFGIAHQLTFDCTETTSWAEVLGFMASFVSMPNVLVLNNLSKTSRNFQANLLEMLIKKSILAETSVLKLPSPFTVIIIESRTFTTLSRSKGKSLERRISSATVAAPESPSSKLLYSLKDHLLFKYFYQIQQTSSALKILESRLPKKTITPLTSETEINNKHIKLCNIRITPELKVYMQNIVVFLRTHRFIRKGVSPQAVRQFDIIVRTMCALTDFDFATPTIISLAAKLVFPLKLEMCNAHEEPSLSYGSDIFLLEKWILKWDVTMIIEDVLKTVPVPV